MAVHMHPNVQRKNKVDALLIQMIKFEADYGERMRLSLFILKRQDIEHEINRLGG